MIPELKTFLVRFYLIFGVFLCSMYFIGAIAGWKLPEVEVGGSGRSGGGFWGVGK